MSSRTGKRKPNPEKYLLAPTRLALTPISSRSFFGDDVWVFPSDLAGRYDVALNWCLQAAPEVWNDARFQLLLLDAKRILYASIIEDNPRPTSIIETGRALRTLVNWMYYRSYWSFSALTRRAADEYYEYICGQYTEDDEITVVNGTIEKFVGSFYLLANKRASFETHPRILIGSSVTHWLNTRGQSSADRAKPLGKIPAVPEDIFNPLMQVSLRWVEAYSADVLELLKVEAEAASVALRWRSKSYTSYINQKLVGFKFSFDRGRRWRPDITEAEQIDVVDEAGARRSVVRPIRVLRLLVADLVAACSIVVLGLVGLRMSELLGLLAGSELVDGLPACVVKRVSSDGIYEVFYIKGRIYKGEKFRGQQEGEWVAGIRPVNSTFVPEPVRAILLLFELTASWRDLLAGDSLFAYPKAQKGIPRTSSGVTLLSSKTLGEIINNFLLKRVELSPKARGWHLTTHQFRKKFAQDVVRSDPDAPTAVREHFKHISMHVLDSAYLWTDGDLSQTVSDIAVRDAATEIMDIIDGIGPFAGRMPDMLRKRSSDIASVAPKSLPRTQRLQNISALVSEEGIRAWPCQFGTCIFRNETARCHFTGKGIYDLTADRPLASERCADLCVGCFNLSISVRFKAYWIERYQENRRVWEGNREQGNVAWAALAKLRAEQAFGVLRAMKVDLKALVHVS